MVDDCTEEEEGEEVIESYTEPTEATLEVGDGESGGLGKENIDIIIERRGGGGRRVVKGGQVEVISLVGGGTKATVRGERRLKG